jgi:hypothetical protein
MQMPTQKREAGKNYIGLLSDAFEAQHAAEAQAAVDRRIRDHVIRLMAAIWKRRSEAS